MDTISLGVVDLVIGAALIVLLAISLHSISQRLARDTVIAAVRTTIQLLLIGLVLKVLFANVDILWLGALATTMLLVAAREIRARQQRAFSGAWGYGLGTLSMFISTFSVTLLALTVVIGPQPWYEPRYAIPLLGMVMGNSMSSISLTLDGLTRQAWQQRELIETRLTLGSDWRLAISTIRRDSVRAGLTPIINAMAAAGIVSLPGMMTGQILAGSPPVEAVKYQILIMFLIATSTGFGVMIAAWLGCRRLFDERQRLRLDRLEPAKAN